MASHTIRTSYGRIGIVLVTLAASAIATSPAYSAPNQLQPNGNRAVDSLFTALNPQKNGVFKIDGVGFMVQHKSENWAPARQRDLIVENGYPQVTPASHTVKGLFKTDSGNYKFTQELTRLSTDKVGYNASLTGTPTKGARILCLSIGLPAEEYKGQKILFGDAECAIPWWYNGQALVKGVQRVNSVRIPLKQGGTLVIESGAGELEANFLDNREYGSAEFDLQISFNPNTGTIQQAQLGVTMARIPATAPLGVAYNPEAKQPARQQSALPKPQKLDLDTALVEVSRARVRPIAPLRPKGEDFVDTAGKPVRFWGMNAVAFYPEHALAEKTAANMASLGINMVRLHHNLRPSTDWAPADTASLLTYDGGSRTPNLKAWERHDYFNARLRERGIYLSVSMHGTRNYRPDDVSILKVSPEDDEAWADAMDDLNHWPWKKAFDSRKMLPVFDERCFQLNAEFATNFLTHVNPYTGIAYGKDAQVVSVELVNEFSTEYTLLCGNVFPEYWTRKLNALLKEYTVVHGVTPFELYKAKTPEQKKSFSDFCNELDATYVRRMEKVIRDAGYTGPIAFSNLWRGDANLRLRAKTDDFIEDHVYEDPFVAGNPNNFLYNVAKSSVAGKPVVIGEFNQAENPKIIQDRKPVLSMLSVAAAAYSSLQDYAGVIWFAWSHGTFRLNAEGWGKTESEGSESIGTLAGNSAILDHMRSAGIIFKNGYLSPSVQPQTIFSEDSYFPGSYNDLMNGETSFQPGWQAVHGFRKAFGPIPAAQKSAPWTQQPPSDLTVSDTRQIVRDARRRQLSFSAPKAEGFSGYLDGNPLGNLKVLDIPGKAGFATVIAVPLDDVPLAKSRKILLSKTYTDANGKGSAPMPFTLNGLAPGRWRMKVTRPAAPASGSETIEIATDGTLNLPASGWSECELVAQ